MLELRGDLVRDVKADWLRQHFEGDLLFTLRSRDEGGRAESAIDARRQRLMAAAKEFDLVDLEAKRDLDRTVLDSVPASKRIISWHGPSKGLSELQSLFAEMASEQARYYKIIPEAGRSRQEMAPLALLHSLRRDDLIAFASGSLGTWTRLVAPRLGAPVIFASAGSTPAAAGQLGLRQLIDDYQYPELGKIEHLFGLVGNGIEHSLSPRIHNWLYRQFDVPAVYIPFEIVEFGEFWLEIVESGSFGVLGLPLAGLSVTSPHKRIASAIAGARSPLVDLIGAANTLISRDHVWEAESTDGLGVVESLRAEGVTVRGCTVAVVGAGGAGRSAVVALSKSGAQVTLVNRSVEPGQKASARLRVPFRSLEGFDPGEFDVLVHATPLGLEADDPLPFEPSLLKSDAVLIDMVYTHEGPTQLVREAKSSAQIAIDGRLPLIYQAIPQFRLMTGCEASAEDLRELVGLPPSR